MKKGFFDPDSRLFIPDSHKTACFTPGIAQAICEMAPGLAGESLDRHWGLPDNGDCALILM
jgi:hypothetical protein